MIELSRNISQNTIADNQIKKRDLNSNRKRILDNIFRDYRNKITPDMVVNKLFITKRQLSRIMQSYYGMSLTQKINQMRINCAKDKLLNTQMTIGEIAHYTGYDTEQYFCKIFKEAENCTPTQFRKTK